PLQPHQRNVDIKTVGDDTIVQHLSWEDKEGQPMLNELRTMRFHAYPDGARAVDFTLLLSPIDRDVTFADAKDAGLCCVRPIPSISLDPQLTNSAGGTGKDCWGKPADWCDESGLVNGKTYGIAMLDHPANPRHPPLWHAHQDARLSGDIFGLHAFDPDKYKAH